MNRRERSSPAAIDGLKTADAIIARIGDDELTTRLERAIQEEADRASEDLAAERGPFPAFTGSRYERGLRHGEWTRRATPGAALLTTAMHGFIAEGMWTTRREANLLDGGAPYYSVYRASDGHVTLAWGRDYSDVSPLRGVIFGGGEHVVKVAVEITPLASS